MRSSVAKNAELLVLAPGGHSAASAARLGWLGKNICTLPVSDHGRFIRAANCSLRRPATDGTRLHAVPDLQEGPETSD